MRFGKLFDHALPRHGVVTGDDLRATDVPASSFHAWRRREQLSRPHHDVTVLPGAPRTVDQRIAIAVAAIGPPCAVTGWAAAYLHGVHSTAPTTIDVLVPHGSSPRAHEHVRVVETSVFEHERIEEVRSIPVVRPDRWLADLSPNTDLDVLVAKAIDLRGSGRLGATDLDRQLGRRRRFTGRRRFRTLADQLREDGSDSGFERRTRDRLTARGTPPDEGQLEVVVSGRRRRIDLPFGHAHAGIECRGFAYHDRDAFDQDAERHNDFVEDGRWRLLELTWTMFLLDWDSFCARLDRVLGV